MQPSSEAVGDDSVFMAPEPRQDIADNFVDDPAFMTQDISLSQMDQSQVPVGVHREKVRSSP